MANDVMILHGAFQLYVRLKVRPPVIDSIFVAKSQGHCDLMAPHSRKRNISEKLRGNVFKCSTNVHYRSRMN